MLFINSEAGDDDSKSLRAIAKENQINESTLRHYVKNLSKHPNL